MDFKSLTKMDQKVLHSNSRNTIRTDLSMLLECLKFQMKCPDLQRQALLTLHSICEKREDAVDMLREMGGVVFVHNLAKSTIVHSDVRETALFTLSTLAEANVYCKNALCRKETFSDIAGWLMKEDIPLTQKRVSVYLLSVLVANNRAGQTLVQSTGCLDILLDLFRTTFPLSAEAALRASRVTQNHQLWVSVSSALCGSVNNPQNEDGQRMCVSAFPVIKVWLQENTLPRTEIFQPLCSFIAMAVANNPFVQENFAASGGLDSLTLALVHHTSAADTSLLSCQLSVTISKTLSACITENSSLASGLARYGLVYHLFSLLMSPHLDPEERLSVLITLGHCTEASEEHQSQLLQCGGLPVIITLLTEDTSEGVQRAATFILQTCKQAMIQGKDSEEHLTNTLKSSAEELQHRIKMLEDRHTKTDAEQDMDLSALLEDKEQALAVDDDQMKPRFFRSPIKNEEPGNVRSTFNKMKEKPKCDVEATCCPLCKGTGALVSSQCQPLGGGREPHTSESPLFKPPAPVRHRAPHPIKRAAEEASRARKMSKDGKIPVTERSQSQIRCAGCVLPFEEVTSRTFTSLQSSCPYGCDMHQALQEVTGRYRALHRNRLFRQKHHSNRANSETGSSAESQKSRKNWRGVSLTPIRKGAVPGHHWLKHKGVTLKPLHKGAKTDTNPNNKTELLPGSSTLKRPPRPAERRGNTNEGHYIFDDKPTLCTDQTPTAARVVKDEPRSLIPSSQRRKRQDFSPEEVQYLLQGVKTLGTSWKSILWSYPFKPGRTNVDLAKKYKKLMATRD